MKCTLVMRMLVILSAALVLPQNMSSTSAQGQSKAAPDREESSQQNLGRNDKPVEVLSDTGGFDIKDFLFKRLVPMVRTKWYSQMPEAVYPPLHKKGRVSITFRILRDGRIEDLKVIRTSGDASLDGAAVRAVTATAPFPPFPSNFTCQFLALEFHFDYNQPEGVDSSKQETDSPLPCVKTKIRSPSEIAVAVSPQSIHVAKGATHQFSATVMGDTDLAVNWKVAGAGCSESQCGVISAPGTYTAPTTIPDPPTVTITATIGAGVGESGSALVTIVESESSH